MEQLYVSQFPLVYTATLCVAPDHVKVRSRRKYVFTDQIDQLIRESYHNRRDEKIRLNIRPLAKKVGIPDWALKKRARELGLARTKELAWSQRELEILSRYAWMSDERIRLKLKAAGYSRTVTGIHLKLKRMRFKHDGSVYSAYSLAQALGIDPHAVTRWIKSGHLKAKFRGTARGPQQNGDSYLIQEKDGRPRLCGRCSSVTDPSLPTFQASSFRIQPFCSWFEMGFYSFGRFPRTAALIRTQDWRLHLTGTSTATARSAPAPCESLNL